MTDPNTGAFSQYNARRSTPAEVAEGFVLPGSYFELADTVEPQLVIGPRGIGKTTLLKMLLPEALDKWVSPHAIEARRRISFTGAFVAADKMWSGTLEQLAASLDPRPNGHQRATRLDTAWEHRYRVGKAAFAFMALAALAEAASYRCRRDGDATQFRWINLSRAREEKLVAVIAPTWLAHPATSTFSGLAEQMRGNLAQLGLLLGRIANPDLSEAAVRKILSASLLDIVFPTAASYFVDVFNRATGEPNANWVLLIDEFEFLPPSARLLLGASVQGNDPRLSYKISLAPYTGLNPFSGTELNDWHKVELSHQQDDKFTRTLLELQFSGPAKVGKPKLDNLLLGRGFANARKDDFAKGSQNARDVRALSTIDPAFDRWLRKLLGNTPLSQLNLKPKQTHTLRRAMPLVRLRLARRRALAEAQDGDTVPTHLVPDIYAGAKNILLLTEGNPRWIKAFADRLRTGPKGETPRSPIIPSRQAKMLANVSWVLYNNLQAVDIQKRSGVDLTQWMPTHPEPADQYVTPHALLTQLGCYLYRQTHDAGFSPNAATIFGIDDSDPWLEDVLNSLIFLGALVVEPGSTHSKHEVVRLSHMWAPIFNLLLHKGRPRPLSKAIDTKGQSRQISRQRIVSSHLAGAQSEPYAAPVEEVEGHMAEVPDDTEVVMRPLVSDRERRVSIMPWPARKLVELRNTPPYDGLLVSVGYEPRSYAIAQALAPRAVSDPKNCVAVEFPAQRTDSYLRSLAWFEEQGFQINRNWGEEFLPFLKSWLLKIASERKDTRIAIDVSSVNRRRIASVVEALAMLRCASTVTVDLLYAPSSFEPPSSLPIGVLSLGPISSYLAGQLQTHSDPVAFVGVGYEPHKAAGALNALEIPCEVAYVPVGPDPRFHDAVVKANEDFLEHSDERPRIEYKVTDPFECFTQLDGRARAVLQAGRVPTMLPLGPKIFALSACLVAAAHYPRVPVWRASFDDQEEPVERQADQWVCGISAQLTRVSPKASGRSG